MQKIKISISKSTFYARAIPLLLRDVGVMTDIVVIAGNANKKLR